MNFGFFCATKTNTTLIGLLLSICMTASGQEAEFIWAEEDLNGTRIVMSSYRGGVWQPGEKIIDDKNLNILPAMGMSRKNQKLAVWSTVSAAGSILKYSLKRGNSWQPAKILSNTMSTNLAPVVVFDNDDIAWVFWSANDGGDDDIFVSKLINGNWTAANRVHADNVVPDILAEAGQDENGNIWVTWQQLQNNAYVEQSQSFELSSKRAMAQASALNTEKLQQLKQRSDKVNSIEPPEFFKARSRATLYFPNNKTRPSMPVDGNIIQ